MKLVISVWVVSFIFIFALLAFAAPAVTLTTTCVQGGNPAEQSFHIQNDGDGKLRYSLSSNEDWLQVHTSVGGTTDEKERNLVVVGYNTLNLPVGIHTGTITIADPLAINSPQTVDVVVTITPPPRIGITP